MTAEQVAGQGASPTFWSWRNLAGGACGLLAGVLLALGAAEILLGSFGGVAGLELMAGGLGALISYLLTSKPNLSRRARWVLAAAAALVILAVFLAVYGPPAWT
ncbi:MAG: hypothetical protein QOD77_1623 [Thermoplasmata archaeon]|jgi:hypothetical protein|nr:hypothetical protein [Thermoplasmata archaeon]